MLEFCSAHLLGTEQGLKLSTVIGQAGWLAGHAIVRVSARPTHNLAVTVGVGHVPQPPSCMAAAIPCQLALQ